MNVRRSPFVAATVVALALGSPCLYAATAQGTIKGRITAVESGRPLAGAHVLLVGSTSVATTSDDGSYTMKAVAAGTWQIQALHVGYEAQKKSVTVPKGDSVRVDFALTTAVVQLQEVVTTATGQQRRTELGNAISTLDIAKKVE